MSCDSFITPAAATAIRAPAAIQNICMPPLVPFLCVELGHFMRHGRWLNEMSAKVWVRESPERLWEWFLGSLWIAPLLAALVGGLVFGAAALVARRTAPARNVSP